jgi:hypothetical protein
MYTHKQQWRRARSRLSLRKKCSQIVYEQQQAANQPEFRRAASDSAVPNFNVPSLCKRLRRYTEPNLSDSNQIPKRGVHFSDENRVVLVPSRKEYIRRGVSKDVWYDSDDYSAFKISARDEIIDYLKQGHCTMKGAINFLYQSTEHDNDDQDNDDDLFDTHGTEGALLQPERAPPICCTPPSHAAPAITTPSPSKRDFRRMGSDQSTTSGDSQLSTGAVESPIDALILTQHHSSSTSLRIKQVSAINERRNVVHPLALLV